jgi:LuxR family maltose regulon positive regulatory protein
MTASTGTAERFGDLLLKVTAPRVPRGLIARERLVSTSEQLRGYPVVLVQAPTGFGKTSLLAQWRREHLGRGAVVAWLSAQPQDDPLRLVQALALSVRQGAGRPTFGHTLLEAPPLGALEGFTTWLADVAQTAMDMVLFIDEAERLPVETADMLVYLMRNAPPNLHVVAAARPELKLAIEDLVDYGQCRAIGASELRFQLNETLSLVGSRFGSRVDNDSAARLHELVEGWPLGLQLALAAISSSTDPQAELALVTRRGALHEQMVGLLLANLDPADVDFLVRISIVDPVQPQLCHALTGEEDAPERLARLARDTPIFAADEHGEWLRMHQLARDVLRQRFGSLPDEQQAHLHARAAGWLADHGLLELAARHALDSGRRDWAYDLAERSLYADLMAHGRQGAVLEWLNRLPPEELDRRPRLLLAAAWTLAISGRHAEGSRLVERVVAHTNVDDALRCECDLILGGAAVYADDPDRFVAFSAPWGETPPLRDPLLLQIFQAMAGYRALLEGEPAVARLREHQVLERAGRGRSYAAGWAEFVIGLAYLREGQVLLAEHQLRATLAASDSDFGRRSHFGCMVAALLAAALWDLDRASDAAGTLANRLDVLEQSGYAEMVALAYRTMARIALASGAENRALELLESLHAVGVARGLPSVCVSSLAEQARLHARRFRAQTCQSLAERIDTLLADPALERGPLWRREVAVQSHLARSYAAIAAQEWRRALSPISEGEALVQQIKEGRLHIEFLGLRALALDRCGEASRPLLREAADLAQAYGLRRVFADAHPLLADLIQRETAPQAGNIPIAAPMRAPLDRTPHPRISPSMALTPKEREVLEMLARNLSNKEIGLAMQVSEQAIKWHMKKLFAKLDAGTRKQVVQRARILGLLEETT